jgi:hypothetical protein
MVNFKQIIESVLGMPMLEFFKYEENLFPIISNTPVITREGKFFVFAEPWHSICFKNWKVNTVSDAHKKFLIWYKKRYPAKRVVYSKFIKTGFPFDSDKGKLMHYGVSFVVSMDVRKK